MGQYVVSMQRSWPDGIPYVEIETGGPDCPSPGMLVCPYDGDGEYDDPREAAEGAIRLRAAWQADTPDEVIEVAIGTTGGGLFCHDPSEVSDDDIRLWGEMEYGRMEKCDQCGNPLPLDARGRPFFYYHAWGEGCGHFCSEACCEKFDADHEDLVIEHNDEYTYWNEDRKEWVEDPSDASTYWRADLTEDDRKRGVVVPLAEAIEFFNREPPTGN